MRDRDPSWKSDGVVKCGSGKQGISLSTVNYTISFIETDCTRDRTGTPRLGRLYGMVVYSFVPRPLNMKSMGTVGING